MDRWVRWNWSGDAEIARLVYHGLLAELHAEADGGNVARQVERLAQRNLAHEFQVVILGRPLGLSGHLQNQRTVVDDV